MAVVIVSAVSMCMKTCRKSYLTTDVYSVDVYIDIAPKTLDP